jgi:mannose-6-phosphate isomerase-like protein (cupin superfamily)
MDSRFNAIASDPGFSIFSVVFFPDRIYHHEYLNATRSARYRYDVREVRSYLDVGCLKGAVYLDGHLMANFFRLEYRASRLIEQTRASDRLLGNTVLANVQLGKLVEDSGAYDRQDATVRLSFDRWINAYQVELWSTLEPPGRLIHDYKVLDLMGYDGQITRIPAFSRFLVDIGAIRQVEVTLQETDRTFPDGHRIATPAVDDNYGRNHQAPNDPEPNSSGNGVRDANYLLDFQRGWYKRSRDVPPVKYRNAMMLGDADGHYTNPDAKSSNVLEMRWLFQRELGGSLVFFHEVTIPPGAVEGSHQHLGSEELYYIIDGTGLVYLREGDDPSLGWQYPTVPREVFGLGTKLFKEIPIEKGSMILTKSGGMHGIRNTGASDLKFVAFLYHAS